ncbi:MAG: M56 family metallopeptidase [Ruminococcaceae bacterium]|nr:M56 family metallopeptidase [Oscillospiraceae bacterium]
MIIVDLAVISLTMSLIILLLLLFSSILGKRYKAKYRYIAWLLVALRLLVPARFDMTTAPLVFEEPDALSRPIISTTPNNEYTDKTDQLPENDRSQNSENSELSILDKGEVKKDKSVVISLSQILTIVWSAGAIVFLAYHITVLALFNAKVKKGAVNLKDNIYISSLIESPMMTGFFKKRVLIPDVPLSERELELILLHENAHAKRGDMWYKLILVAANAMHWFNPFAYLMVKMANRDLEYSCDDTVTGQMTPDEKKEYSLTLLRFMYHDTKKEEQT